MSQGTLNKTRTPKRKRTAEFECMECGKLFYSTKAAERASFGPNGCPGCGGADIDIHVPDGYYPPEDYQPAPEPTEPVAEHLCHPLMRSHGVG